LARFLRARRDALSPAALGLAPGARRRAPGLRREEVAALAGLSATWLTWIEQGRDVSVSAAALDRLARALRLSEAERAYLFELGGRRDPRGGLGAGGDVPAEIARAAEVFPHPAYVLDGLWDARAWNAGAARLFVGWLDGGTARPNLLDYVFRAAEARALIADWPARARRLVAEFRADQGRHLDDGPVAALVARLARESADFAAFWQGESVLGREGGSRAFLHPRDGRLAFRQVTLAPAGRPDLKLVLLMPDVG
jgi:transcriptional regulator with XRE-family HTH domain